VIGVGGVIIGGLVAGATAWVTQRSAQRHQAMMQRESLESQGKLQAEEFKHQAAMQGEAHRHELFISARADRRAKYTAMAESLSRLEGAFSEVYGWLVNYGNYLTYDPSGDYPGTSHHAPVPELFSVICARVPKEFDKVNSDLSRVAWYGSESIRKELGAQMAFADVLHVRLRNQSVVDADKRSAWLNDKEKWRDRLLEKLDLMHAELRDEPNAD
jgi:hypothetical protein